MLCLPFDLYRNVHLLYLYICELSIVGQYFLISDNTGSGATSGGSDNLVEYMKEEKFSPVYNTKRGVVNIPQKSVAVNGGRREVKLGDMAS